MGSVTKRTGIVIILLFLQFFLFPVDLQFAHRAGDNYRIVTEVHENVKMNRKLIFSTEILNRIAVSIKGSREGSGEIEAVYQISEKDDAGGYLWNSEDLVRFERSPRGVYSGLEIDSSLPSVRNVPRFPEEEVSPGAQWNFPGEEVHDLLPFFQIDYRLHIPFRAFYTYEGEVEEEGRTLDRIIIEYHLFYEEDPVETSLKHPDWGSLFPEKIVGSFYQEYYWDREAGRPARVEDRFEYTYYLNDDSSYTFSGVSLGNVLFAEKMDKEGIADEISRDLEEKGINDIRVTPEKEGVKITLEDIRFQPDSPVLEESEIPKLERISEILMKYTDRDILITGHTARFGTEESSQLLSEQRAAAVASYFLENNIRDNREIVTRGYGSRRPVGDNSTDEGQKMNRRVEITILEN